MDVKQDLDTLQTRYRPNKWRNIIGQEHITDVLKGILKNQTYHYTRSYILSGSPGSGKTSTARLFAAGINCDSEDHTNKPCHSCKSCQLFFSGQYPDYLEVDAGQYNKVEDVKKLIDVAKIYPVNPSKFRVILLDEAHRLSNAAWDSMLKLLEDGVTKTIFLFATTEGDKIRRAIHSRSISFQVKPLSVAEIRNELIRICELENIEYDTKSIESIAHSNRGRMRDAIKVLDMYNRSKGKITEITISTSEEKFCQILTYTSMGKIQDALEMLDKMTMETTNIGDCLCNTLSAVYSYPILNTSGVPESVLNQTKKILGNSINRVIELFMSYKPENYEQVKLFLTILSDLGNQKQKQVQNTTKRVLFKARNIGEQEEDEEL